MDVRWSASNRAGATTCGVDAQSGSASPANASTAVTVREWGQRWLERRAREGVRSIGDDRSRWRVHVEIASWIDRPLSSVSRLDAREWLSQLCCKLQANAHRKNPKPLAAQTIKNILNLARSCFGEAEDVGLISENPFLGLKVRRSRHARTKDVWTVVRPLEQEPALLAMPTPQRWIVGFALGSCSRKGETFSLRLADVHLDATPPHVIFRYTRAGDPTKSGKPRKLYLFGLALYSLQLWLPQLKTFAPENPLGLVFPHPDGTERTGDRPVSEFRHFVKRLGRHCRWHDLRHTGLTSLHAGWWGPALSLEVVQQIAGHSSRSITERYAHWLEENLQLEHAAELMTTGVLRPLAKTMGGFSFMTKPVQGSDSSPAAPSATEEGKQRRGSQVVRQRFAKPLSDAVESAPIAGSPATHDAQRSTPETVAPPASEPAKKIRGAADVAELGVAIRSLCAACVAIEEPVGAHGFDLDPGPWPSRRCDLCGLDDKGPRAVYAVPLAKRDDVPWFRDEEEDEACAAISSSSETPSSLSPSPSSSSSLSPPVDSGGDSCSKRTPAEVLGFDLKPGKPRTGEPLRAWKFCPHCGEGLS